MAEKTNANAGAAIEYETIEFVWLGKPRQDLFCNHSRLLCGHDQIGIQGPQQYNKFIATYSCNDIATSDGIAQTATHLNQQQVARGMATGVID